MKCRHCYNALEHLFLDLGFAPPSNAYLTTNDLKAPEPHFPLKLLVCDKCWLVQTEDYAKADELFDNDYAYFSSISKSWLDHSLAYFELVKERFSLNGDSHVIEVASNDGYLLKNFVADNIPCLGIEPTASTAIAAEKLADYIDVFCEEGFFNYEQTVRICEAGKKYGLKPKIHANQLHRFQLRFSTSFEVYVGNCSHLKLQQRPVVIYYTHELRQTQNDGK